MAELATGTAARHSGLESPATCLLHHERLLAALRVVIAPQKFPDPLHDGFFGIDIIEELGAV
jgi:hypothetical protein